MAKSETDLIPYIAVEKRVLGVGYWRDAVPVEELQKRYGRSVITEQDLSEYGIIDVDGASVDSTFLRRAGAHLQEMVDSGKFPLSPSEWSTLWEAERLYGGAYFVGREKSEGVRRPTDLWGKRLKRAIAEHYNVLCDGWEEAGRSTSYGFHLAVFTSVLLPYIDAAREEIVSAYAAEAEGWVDLYPSYTFPAELEAAVHGFSIRIDVRYIRPLEKKFHVLTSREDPDRAELGGA